MHMQNKQENLNEKMCSIQWADFFLLFEAGAVFVIFLFFRLLTMCANPILNTEDTQPPFLRRSFVGSVIWWAFFHSLCLCQMRKLCTHLNKIVCFLISSSIVVTNVILIVEDTTNGFVHSIMQNALSKSICVFPKHSHDFQLIFIWTLWKYMTLMCKRLSD